MSRDVITVGSTMRIPLLYRGEYSQWRERFMNYLEEQTDGEAMINSIQNGDQPLPVIAQVSLAGTAQNAPPTLKDLKFWIAEEKKTRKIDRLARSLLIQGLPNDIYSRIDSNETAKDLWDALERQMQGSEYGEQDRKAVILYETFKAIEGEQLLDNYLRYLQVINDLKKCGYKKDNYMNDALGYKKKAVVVHSDPLALVVEKTNVSKRKEKLLFLWILKEVSANKEQEFVKTDDKKVEKNADEKKRDMSKVKCYNCKKEGHFAKDCKKAKVKHYNYYKTKMFLAKKDSDEQVLLVQDQAWMESSSDSDQEINANMEKNNEFNDKIKVLNEKNADLLAQTKVLKDQLQVKHVVIDTHVECHEKYAKLEAERYEYMIRYSALFDNDKQHRKQRADQEVLKGIGFENLSYFEKAKDLRPTLYDEKVIGLGYTPMFLTHSDEALEIENFKRSRENKIEFAYDYGNLNASYVNEKINFEDDYFQEIINPDFKKIDSPFQQTSSLKQYVLNVILKKIIIDLEDEVIVQICLWIIDSGCSKHMTGNRHLLMNFVEKFLGTVRFGKNDFIVIAGYGDVVTWDQKRHSDSHGKDIEYEILNGAKCVLGEV
nr:integrase, catalytic region, zinc finger, CCHC-type, peptidase aspartic, catalytic [Tanacetum cinerariifolium]